MSSRTYPESAYTRLDHPATRSTLVQPKHPLYHAKLTGAVTLSTSTCHEKLKKHSSTIDTLEQGPPTISSSRVALSAHSRVRISTAEPSRPAGIALGYPSTAQTKSLRAALLTSPEWNSKDSTTLKDFRSQTEATPYRQAPNSQPKTDLVLSEEDPASPISLPQATNSASS